MYFTIGCLSLLATTLLPNQQLNACAWDYDTIAMERQRFPEAHELIVGYFVRHSDAYYQWRIEDRLKTPFGNRTPAQYDDIAVAYDKLGDSPKAIATMLEKMQRWPDQLKYESQANLGTFYIHNNELEKGLIHIKKAIEINPDAHFGREIYQQLLVEYVIEQRETNGNNNLPLNRSTDTVFPGFSEYVFNKFQDENGSFEGKEFKKAAKGILGMMRFGHYDSPILLEALGDVLLFRVGSGQSNMIAARAYLKAAMETDSQTAKAIYRKKADRALFMQEVIGTSRVQKDLEDEIKQGKALFAQIQADEQAWVKAGKNLDKAFQDKYYNSSLPVMKVNWHFYDTIPLNVRMAFTVIIVCLAVLISMYRYRRKHKAQAKLQVS
ncbi:MAG TPA: hypothetical protein DCM28_12170 [Phycisphaerales bacterium]|nr:hypothetical protein [Phycisphaerales bacterium]|tara:strand:- start:22559 stop:23698 length:1140 start_codon:yes stop_codon:yes gene_type:complete